MPGMSGVEATREIRKHEKETGRYVPIVAVTASDTEDHCLEAGMDDCIYKPCDYHRMMKKWFPDLNVVGS